MSRRLAGLLVLVSACGTGAAEAPAPVTPRDPGSGTSWCSAVDAVLTGKDTTGLRCLAVPNFLLTGFFGPPQNPERSDFVNACFAGNADAAARLRMNVRPVGDLGFRHRSRQRVSARAELDLGFLGPWAPRFSGRLSDDTELEVEVSLDDAEMRVLPSVAEILAQELAAAEEGSPLQQSLETCVSSVCSSGERLVYTAKVLAAVPVITLRSRSRAGRALAVAPATSSFEVDRANSSGSVLRLRAREKLNVAALLEPAAKAFESAGTCQRARTQRTRREVLTGLREMGLRTLSGRALDQVPELAGPLRTSAEAAFTGNERSTLVQTIEAIEGAARQLALPRPNNSLCATRSLAAAVLTGSESDNSLRSVLVDVLTPVHDRLTELANQQALPCADPIWYRDLDRDGYGDKNVTERASRQPPGYVSNALDCYDQNPEAHPGQTRYYEQHRGDGSFDFDCDGKSVKKDDVTTEGCRSSTILGIPTRCWADVGWQGASPGCGEQGRWLAECEISTLSCRPTKELKTVQLCR